MSIYCLFQKGKELSITYSFGMVNSNGIDVVWFFSINSLTAVKINKFVRLKCLCIQSKINLLFYTKQK